MVSRAQKVVKKPIQPQWEEIFDSLGDGLVVLDKDQRLIGMNPAAERITGFSAETVLGLTLQGAFSLNGAVLQVLEPSFKEVQISTFREIPWKAKGGEAETVDLSSTPLIDDEGRLVGWILLFRDITPLKNLEEEIRKADRLAMMGTVAAGLAHEIKNPLGGIKGAAQLLVREKLSPASTECLEIIIREVDRVDRLVGQLLTFSKPKTLSLGPLNLNELLNSLLTLQKNLLDGRKIRLVREFDPSLPPILGDTNELSQVFLNFIKNAIEAIPEGEGEIRVKTRLMTNFKIKGGAKERPSRMVLSEIHDTGVGIPPDDLEKVFTPFFTTKEKGYGLGLAVAQRVINEHGGIVRISSEKKRGTTVQVFLRSNW